MDSIDMVLYQKGPDDGTETQFYVRAVFDDADTDRYTEGKKFPNINPCLRIYKGGKFCSKISIL